MPSYYTLYIDESGDFGEEIPGRKPDNRSWILSGVLFAANLKEAETHLKRALQPIEAHYTTELEAYREPVGELPIFHLGALREYLLERNPQIAFSTAASIAKKAFLAVEKMRLPVRYFTVLNENKTIVPGHSDGTYLAMLPELVAQVEAALGTRERPERLRIVVAKRGKRNETEDIEYSVEEITQSVTMGLASRGLAELLRGDRLPIKHKVADIYWGLRLADFVANCVANEHVETIGPVVQHLEQSGQLRRFVAFGTYQERKARIAERDGDYALALRWWMAVEAPDQMELRGCLARAMHQSGADNLRATTDSLIERLWQEYRDQGSYQELYQQLSRLEWAFNTTISAAEYGERYLPALFRLQTFHLSISNHLGNAEEAENLISAQRRIRMQISATPENLPLILRYDITYLVTLENQLALQELYRCAEDYRNLIRQYAICWRAINNVVVGDETDNTFSKSRTFIAAETAYLRMQLLTTGISVPEQRDTLSLETITTQLQSMLTNSELHADDYGRIRNLLVLAWLKQSEYVRALSLAEADLTDASDPFHIFVAVKAATDACLFGDSHTLKACRRILDYLRRLAATDSLNLTRHPYELIWREWGLLEFLVAKNLPKAMHCLGESRKRHQNHSPIYRFLSCVLTLHEEFIKGIDLTPLTTHFTAQDANCLVIAQAAEHLVKVKQSPNLLQAVRYVSPY